MERALLVDPLVGVGTEAVPHRLNQVLREATGAVAVDVVESAAEAGNGNAGLGGTATIEPVPATVG